MVLSAWSLSSLARLRSNFAGGLFLILSVGVKVASQDLFFLIFVGVVCLDRGMLMFFVGLLVLRGFVGVKCVMAICGAKCSVFSWCEVGYGYLRVLSLNECTDFTMYRFVHVVLCINRYRYRYKYSNKNNQKRYPHTMPVKTPTTTWPLSK